MPVFPPPLPDRENPRANATHDASGGCRQHMRLPSPHAARHPRRPLEGIVRVSADEPESQESGYHESGEVRVPTTH